MVTRVAIPHVFSPSSTSSAGRSSCLIFNAFTNALIFSFIVLCVYGLFSVSFSPGGLDSASAIPFCSPGTYSNRHSTEDKSSSRRASLGVRLQEPQFPSGLWSLRYVNGYPEPWNRGIRLAGSKDPVKSPVKLEATIELTTTPRLPRQRAQQLNENMRGALKKILDPMIEAGILKRSSSPFVSRALLLPKAAKPGQSCIMSQRTTSNSGSVGFAG